MWELMPPKAKYGLSIGISILIFLMYKECFKFPFARIYLLYDQYHYHPCLVIWKVFMEIYLFWYL